MRILIVSYSYSPALTPRAFRWTAIAEALVSAGYEVDVVTRGESDLAVSEKINEVMVYRVGTNFRDSVRRLLGSSSPSRASMTVIAGNYARLKLWRSNIFARLIKWIYNHSVRNVMWPDFACFWYFPAASCARRLMNKKTYDAVVSVSLPFTGHLVGLMLKRGFRKRWIVDIGDPFSFMNETPVNNHKLFSWLNRFAEAKVLKNADVVTVTTDETQAKYRTNFPDNASKIMVIPPLFVEPEKFRGSSGMPRCDGRIKLVFAGTLYRGIRSPDVLLQLFEALLATTVGPKLELHFYGVINDCEPCFSKYKALIGASLFLHGLVPRLEAMRAMKDADVLVNIGNQTTYQLPSKVVEYAMQGKPILNIVKLVDDSSGSFFADFEGVCTVGEGVVRDSFEFGRILEFIEHPPNISPDYISRLASRHGIRAIARSYQDLISENPVAI